MKFIECYIKNIGCLNTLSAYYYYYKYNTKIKKKFKKKKSILVNFTSSFYKIGMKIIIRPIKKISSKKSWEVVKIIK
ncbi:30S ribosomal protein S17 [Candidatus Vidania fulgoroideorum]